MGKISIVAITIIMISQLFSSFTLTSLDIPCDNSTTIENSGSSDIVSTERDSSIISNNLHLQKYLTNVKQNGLNNHFTANLGQVNKDVKYYLQGKGVWFTSTGIVFELIEPSREKNTNFNRSGIPIIGTGNDQQEKYDQRSVVVRLDFANCNNVIPTGEGELSFKSNFFYGNDSEEWVTDVPNYRSILYRDIYDNIDLRYYFNEDGLKYDLIVQPGGDPNDIAIKVEGAAELIHHPATLGSSSRQIDASIHTHSESLTIRSDFAELVDADLFVYQEIDNRPIEVDADFKLFDSDSYGFTIMDEYDQNKPLVIDPLIFSTYLGGGDYENVYDMDTDEQGNAYITGITRSSNFPVKSGSNDTSYNGGDKDIFVTKLNNMGTSLEYSTFIGGNNNDESYSIFVDSNGSAYLGGGSRSDNFPTTSGAYDESYNDLGNEHNDVIVCKLSSQGNILDFSTYIGSSKEEMAFDLIVDIHGNIYITGWAYSLYPTTPGTYNSTVIGSYHILISKLNSTGTDLIYSTLIGGLGDFGEGIALDKDNNICVSGWASSAVFPTTSGAYRQKTLDVAEDFVMKLNANLSSLLFSTVTGNSQNHGYDYSKPDILIDSDDNVIIIANAIEKNYPLTDVLILKFNFNLSTLLYTKYYGGDKIDFFQRSTLDHDGNIIFTGYTNSSDLPILEGVYDMSFNGYYDAFAAKLDITESKLLYSTYIGSTGDETGFGIAEGKNKTIYVAGTAGQGFPTTAGSYSPTYNGGISDAFVLRLKLVTPSFGIDLARSKPGVYRADSVDLYSNASDYEDDEWQLRPHFEIKPSGTPVAWFNYSLSEPVYLNDRWQTTFSVPINATLGYYNIRVRYNDTDDMWSRWYYLNESLIVMNNPPQIDYFNLSKDTVVIGEEFTVYANGTDIEDAINELTFESQYKYTSDTAWIDLDYDKKEFIETKWEYDLTIGPDMEYGYYDFRVCVNDSDNDFSQWKYLVKSLLVLPAPPFVISIELSDEMIYRTDVFWVYTNCTDADSAVDELSVELQYMPVIEKEWHDLSADYYEPRWESYMKSQKTWSLGNYSFRARVTDWEDNVSPWYYLNDSLVVLNNVPEMIDIKDVPAEMLRNSSTVIKVDAKDTENAEGELKIELEYKSPGTVSWQTEYLSAGEYTDNSWNINLNLPEIAPTGTYSFRARVRDLDGDWSPYVYLNDSMLVRNALPEVLSFEQTPAEVYRTETVRITALGTDLETPPELLGCEIYYLEPGSIALDQLITEYNKTSGSWQAELITTKTSHIGNYSFKVQFSDNDGAYSKPLYSNRSVWVRNNLPVILLELDDIAVGKTQYILKLTDYGYDVETSKGSLKWQIDTTSVNTGLYHIETENIGSQEITIYPVKNKRGSDDLTVILIDADGGSAVRSDVTVIVDSRSSGTPADENESPMPELTKGSSIWIILLIIIIVMFLIIIFLYYRRKKQKEKEEIERAEEEMKTAESAGIEAVTSEQVPPPEGDIAALDISAPETAGALEEPSIPVPVPMSVPAETPELPPAGEPKIEEESGIELESESVGEGESVPEPLAPNTESSADSPRPTDPLVLCPTCGSQIPTYAMHCPSCNTVLNWS